MSHRIQTPYQRVDGFRTAVMRHAPWTVAVLALIYALVALYAHRYDQFAVIAVLFIASTLIDLHVHRRGRYRERSGVLLFIAAVAIPVSMLFAQVWVTA